MMTTNEILSELLREPKNPYGFLRHLLFLQSKLFPIAVRFSAEILSPYGELPSQSGFLEIVVSSW